MAGMALRAVRPPQEAKTRLARALSPAQRAELALSTARHVLGCLTQVLPPSRCILISRSATMRGLARAAGAVALVEEGADQNAALTQAAHHARTLGASRILSISSDLPPLTAADVAAMLQGGSRIAPDRHSRGTNALCIAPPLALLHLHGPDSLARHKAAAAADIPLTRVVRIGLAHDVDEPDDLRLSPSPPVPARQMPVIAAERGPPIRLDLISPRRHRRGRYAA